MYTDESDLHECAARIHAQLATSRQHIHETLACPYCDCQLFYEDEKLFDHVCRSHDAKIRAFGVHNITPFFRELLRDEALYKAQQAASMQRQLRFGTLGCRRCSSLTGAMSNLTLLNLQGSPDCFPDYQNDKPVQADGATTVSEPRVIGNDAVEPERCWRDLPHRIGRNGETTDLCTKPQVTARKPYTRPRAELLYPVQQQDPQCNTSSDNGSGSSLAAATSRPLLLPASYQTLVLVMPTNKQWPDLALQPDSRPISQEQLAVEIKTIYAGLTMVESKCINVNKTQPPFHTDPVSDQPLISTSEYWQTLIALHNTLLHEHHDFFLASQHPLASPAVRRLAAKYSMPERMWKHGIHSFLELLHDHLPDSLEYMITFCWDITQSIRTE